MTTLGTTLDIEPLLGKCRNRIHRIGIELEGGWDRLPIGIDGLHNDVSVRFEGSVRPAYRGEIPSKPMVIEEWPTWLREKYPAHVNETCGLHVHMSLRNALLYQRLMTKDYLTSVIKYLKEWGTTEGIAPGHPFWNRVNGNNRFCVTEFHADFQAIATNKEDNRRRTFINYPFSMHQTVECRGLPMFDNAEIAARAIKHLLDITNAFLVSQARREEKVSASLDANSELLKEREEYRESI